MIGLLAGLLGNLDMTLRPSILRLIRRTTVLTRMCHTFRNRECVRLDLQLDLSPCTRRWSVEVYVPEDPHQGTPVVSGYAYVCVNVIHLIYISTYTYKYIEHETANWLGWEGRRSQQCRRCG